MYSIETAIYQSEQIREFERLAQEKFAVTSDLMMQRAGEAAFKFLLQRWPNVKNLAVFCGSGNNGGDGYVVAQLAHAHGLNVTVWQVGSYEHVKEECRNALAACQKAGISISVFDPKKDLHNPDLIVDAICGIGLRDKLRDNTLSAIKTIEQTGIPVLAIDIPSGINADTGELLGAAIHATATITFIGLKLGLLTGHGIAYTGELVCDDLQLPGDLFSSVKPIAQKINLSDYAAYLKPRPRDWHKGLSGHVLIIGGDYGFTGAPRMAAEAALHVGAGLVSVATLPDNAGSMNINFPEIMSQGVDTIEKLEQLISKADVVVIGPGLGQSNWSKKMWDYVVTKDIPKVVDADALNLLAKSNKVSENWILTPHPGEAARLLGLTSAVIQENRLEAAKAISQRYGGVCVLKGAGSLVIAPGFLPGLCDRGNPGMATAGMGDVLSGVIGGLLGQGIPLGDAAKLGVCMHAMAGDLAAEDGERGMVATDLLPYLRRLANST